MTTWQIQLSPHDTFDEWHPYARYLLNQKIPPHQVVWQTQGTDDLFAGNNSEQQITPELTADVQGNESRQRVNKHFIPLAKYACCHQNPQRFQRLYQLLWRLVYEEGKLLTNVTDDDVHQVSQWAKAVARDRHKMKAFVRFRQLQFRDINSASGQKEMYVAWFEPSHYIVKLTADFFCDRFTNMDWSILTPYQSIHWLDKKLFVTGGSDKNQIPVEDELEEHWRTYYSSIFNPARLKVKAMCAEMPKKYWHNLPEASLIKPLTEQAEQAKQAMLNQTPTETRLPQQTKFNRRDWLDKKHSVTQ